LTTPQSIAYIASTLASVGLEREEKSDDPP